MKKELLKTTDKELIKTLAEKRLALRNFHFASTGGKAKNVKEGRNIKKEIAVILTELSSRAKVATH
jgi:ribosomal protein L29